MLTVLIDPIVCITGNLLDIHMSTVIPECADSSMLAVRVYGVIALTSDTYLVQYGVVQR